MKNEKEKRMVMNNLIMWEFKNLQSFSMENLKKPFSRTTGKLKTSISICRIQVQFYKMKKPLCLKKIEGKHQNVKSDAVRVVRSHR